MKSGNYEVLLDKFYAGTASAEEVLSLKNEGFLDEQDELYANTIKHEKDQQMDWSFENFLKEVPQAKVVALPQRNNWKRNAMAAAAVVLAILTVYILIPQSKQDLGNETANMPVNNKISDSNSQQVAEIILPVVKTKDSTTDVQKMVATIEKRKVAADKKARLAIDKTILKPTPKENSETKTDFDEYLVMVNGKPIYNEEDALSITRESLGLVSRNLTTTMDEMKPIGHIKIKF